MLQREKGGHSSAKEIKKRRWGCKLVEKLIGTNTEYFIKCTISNMFCLSHSPMAYKNALFFLVNYFIITLL